MKHGVNKLIFSLAILITFPMLIYSQISFDTFLKDFSRDSTFQVHHIKFPYSKIVLDDEGFSYDTIIVDKKRHLHIDFLSSMEELFESYPVIYIKSNIFIHKNNYLCYKKIWEEK